MGLTSFCCVARRRSGMTRRDLIGAWHRPQQALSAGLSHIRDGKDVDRVMIVLGADAHKRSHTIAAIEAATGQVLGDKTGRGDRARVRSAVDLGARPGPRAGFGRWKIAGTCRARLERFLIARGERVGSRLDPVDGRVSALKPRARQVRPDRRDLGRPGRAGFPALRSLPTAALAGPELDLRLLVDHRERLVRAARGAQQHAAVEPARSVARARAAGRRAVLGQMEQPDRPAPGPRRTDDARPDRPRQAAPLA